MAGFIPSASAPTAATTASLLASPRARLAARLPAEHWSSPSPGAPLLAVPPQPLRLWLWVAPSSQPSSARRLPLLSASPAAHAACSVQPSDSSSGIRWAASSSGTLQRKCARGAPEGAHISSWLGRRCSFLQRFRLPELLTNT